MNHNGTEPGRFHSGRQVAVVAYTEYPYDMRIRREAEALIQDGYQVSVITAQSTSNLPPAHLGGVHLYEVPLRIRRGGKVRYLYQYATFFLLSSALLLWLHLRKHFDLVHIHSLPDFQVFCAASLKLSGVPILLDLHEAMPEVFAARFHADSGSLWFRAAAMMEEISGRFADHIIVANDGIKAAVASRGMPVERITAVYNVGDAPMEPVSPQELFQTLDLPRGRLIVHAGGINPERDLETALKALADLPTERDVYLVIAGTGEREYLDALGQVADHLGISNRVKFVGRLSLAQTRALMSLSEVGLVTLARNPLTEIAWPTRIAEFAHLGKPLVVPRLRFLGDVLKDSAHYYVPGDAKSLARALDDVMANAENSMPAILKASKICQQFDWDQMRNRLLGVYNHLSRPAIS